MSPVWFSFLLLEDQQKHEGSSAFYTPCELSGSRPAWTSRLCREEFLAGARELDYVIVGIYKPGTLLRSQVPSPACNHALRASGRIRNTPLSGKVSGVLACQGGCGVYPVKELNGGHCAGGRAYFQVVLSNGQFWKSGEPRERSGLVFWTQIHKACSHIAVGFNPRSRATVSPCVA